MKDELRTIPAWGILATLTTGMVLALAYRLTGRIDSPEVGYALLLLGLNLGFFLLAAWIPRRGGLWETPHAGLLLMSLKLFVNTFTIFLFIGLQAVRSAVFVPQFFSAYLLLLAGSVYLLNRNP